jgi:hypothetical protein
VALRERTKIDFGGHDPGRGGRSVTASVAGFGLIARLADDLSAIGDAEVTVDFSQVSWFEAHLVASLEIVFRQAAQRGTVVRIAGLQPRLKDAFLRNRLIGGTPPERGHTVIPMGAFSAVEGRRMIAHVSHHLGRPGMPPLPAALRSSFLDAIEELFANAALHARTHLPIAVGGQLFPRTGRLAFSVADGGLGMRPAVAARLGRDLPAAEAISWAMEPRNGTRQGSIPGGLGSRMLREIVEANGGRLTIVSNDGFWSQRGARVMVRSLARPFPGTTAVLELGIAGPSADQEGVTP